MPVPVAACGSAASLRGVVSSVYAGGSTYGGGGGGAARRKKGLMDRVEFHIGSGCTAKGRSRCKRREGPGTTLKPSPVNWGDGGGLGARCVVGEEGGSSCCGTGGLVVGAEGCADDDESVGSDALPGR